MDTDEEKVRICTDKVPGGSRAFWQQIQRKETLVGEAQAKAKFAATQVTKSEPAIRDR